MDVFESNLNEDGKIIDFLSGEALEPRLVVTQSSLYFDNQAPGSACDSIIPPPMGQNASMEIPSGEIKLNREFDVTAGRPTTILLDFDGNRSINQTRNNRYMMNPVISIVSVQ
ncbi:MAG: DUF4382 domain-containing protein [Syntrophales bacterium LBB04]|nr:DUF4382 domain-containing protein [Syntrophales bacterium LBB04]